MIKRRGGVQAKEKKKKKSYLILLEIGLFGGLGLELI